MRVEAKKITPDYVPTRVEYTRAPLIKEPAPGEIEKINTKSEVNEENLSQAVDKLNITMSTHSLQFKIHEESGRCQVKVIDDQTDEVIRELPPDAILDLSARIKEMLDKEMGVLLDTQA